jgi:beta-lactam-binding protein with PASTA domain
MAQSKFFKSVSYFIWLLPFIAFAAGYILFDHLFTIKEIEAPNLVGKTISQALHDISACKLNPRLIDTKEDINLPAGTILSQSPLPQQKIKPNQSLFLVLSTIPLKLKAPNFLHKDQTEIENELALLRIKPKFHTINSPYPAHTCFAQWPQAGSELDGNIMNIYISSPTSYLILMPNFKGKLVPHVTDFLAQHSIKPMITHTSQDDVPHNCMYCIVADQRPLAGSIIERSLTKPLAIQLLVRN